MIIYYSSEDNSLRVIMITSRMRLHKGGLANRLNGIHGIIDGVGFQIESMEYSEQNNDKIITEIVVKRHPDLHLVLSELCILDDSAIGEYCDRDIKRRKDIG